MTTSYVFLYSSWLQRQWHSQDFVSGVAVSIVQTRDRLKTRSSAIANAVAAHRILRAGVRSAK